METSYFKQGDDGLCGFYAIINAVKYLNNSSSDAGPSEFSDEKLFDEAVESLARTYGADIRILKRNPDVGGIDVFQIAPLVSDLIYRLQLPYSVSIHRGEETFSQIYRTAWRSSKNFALAICYRNGKHWVTAARRNETEYWLIDNSQPKVGLVDARTSPQLSGTGCLITRHTA